jgi:hypothetical protein
MCDWNVDIDVLAMVLLKRKVVRIEPQLRAESCIALVQLLECSDTCREEQIQHFLDDSFGLLLLVLGHDGMKNEVL